MSTPHLPSRVLDLALAIQQIPAPTFSEAQRAEAIRRLFHQEGLSDVSIDLTGNVYARLPGGPGRPLVLSAHLDTVFPLETNLHPTAGDGTLNAPGIGDNALGVAGLFALVWALRAKGAAFGRPATLPGDVWLAANVCEEGLGDLRGMKAVVDRFGAAPLAYIVLEGMALGQIYHRGLGVQRYRIAARTSGGHSWADYGRPSAVHELSRLVAQLADLQLPEAPRTSLNVGVIAGGTSVNTIAAEAHLELDLRSEEVNTLSTLAARVETLTQAACRPEVIVTAEIIGQRPAGELAIEHPLVQWAKNCVQTYDGQPRLSIGSTDANIPLSRGLPAVCIGLTVGGNAHTVQEFIQLAPLEKGLAQLVMLVEGAWENIPR